MKQFGLTSIMRSAACAGSIAVVTAVASCRSPTENVPPDLVQLFEHYRKGKFIYRDNSCFFVAAATDVEMQYTCGWLLVGPQTGLSSSDIGDLLDEIDAEILREVGGQYPRILVAVPPRSERDALLRLLKDARLRYAVLDFG
jgi:hypothetical protein